MNCVLYTDSAIYIDINWQSYIGIKLTDRAIGINCIKCIEK